MTKSRVLHIVCALAAVLRAGHPATAEPLNVAPGSDPGGTAVGVLTSPFPLDSADVIQILARDGEGVAIGWDFSRQAENSNSDTRIATTAPIPEVVPALTAKSELRLVPTFIDRLRPTTWAQAVAFLAQTPARIVVVPFSTSAETDWVAFRAAAEHFPNLLFVVPAQSTNTDAVQETAAPDALGYPAKFRLANVLSISATVHPNADVVLALPSDTPTPDSALAATVKALLFCPADQDVPQPAMSKLDALAKLGMLGRPQETDVPSEGPRPITPCPAALN